MSESSLSALLTQGIKRELLTAMKGMGSNGLVSKVCTVAPSTSRSETYAWLGQAPQMIEYGSSTTASQPNLTVKALSETSYTITNKNFGAAITVDRSDWMDDQARGLQLRAQQLAAVAVGHQDKLVVDMLTGGTSNLCYDGTAFFGNSHPARKDEGSTQDNLLAGTGVTTSAVADDFNSAISAMMGFLAENGEPFHASGIRNLAVVAPPALRKPMLEALNASIISNTTNVQTAGFNIDLIFESRLAATDANDWYLLATDGLRPLIFQDREGLRVEDTIGGDTAVLSDQYTFAVKARYNVGYGLWANACKVVNA